MLSDLPSYDPNNPQNAAEECHSGYEKITDIDECTKVMVQANGSGIPVSHDRDARSDQNSGREPPGCWHYGHNNDNRIFFNTAPRDEQPIGGTTVRRRTKKLVCKPITQAASATGTSRYVFMGESSYGPGKWYISDGTGNTIRHNGEVGCRTPRSGGSDAVCDHSNKTVVECESLCDDHPICRGFSWNEGEINVG